MTRYGSDVVASLLAEVGVEHVALNPGASFRGVHDSLVNGPEPRPELVLCLHEEIAVAVAHGYAKASGRPMAVLLHDVVGLQHATMAIYNAWCDRAPVLVIGGTGPMSKVERRPWIDWIHTALVQGSQVRDYVKWDDQPHDLASVPESFARAWRTTSAAPPGPVYLCLDASLQEQAVPEGFAYAGPDTYPTPSPPGLARGDAAWLARLLAGARLPLLLTDYAGDTEAGFAALRELAELLHAPVVDCAGRFNFPTGHELNASGLEDELLGEADVVVALDVEDLAGRIGPKLLELGEARTRATVVNVSPAHLRLRSWAQDYQQSLPADRHLTASCESALPDLVAACREDAPSRAAIEDRRRLLAGRRDARLRAWAGEASGAEAPGAVHPARLARELGAAISGRRWTLAAGSLGGWERRLWPFERHRQHLGWHGGGGLGYNAGAAVGAALALDRDTLCICIQPDGDLLFTPSALWTAANRSLPILFVMHNNRQYQNTVEHAERVALERGRPVERRHVGSAIADPNVDFALLARSLGVWGTGPVTSPESLGDAVSGALEVVDAGRPALVDVVTAGA